MPSELPKSINLLEPVAVPKNTWEKIYDWVFSVGRFVIIIVELVVLAAFGSRFYFDRKNNDLKDSIDAKVQMIEAQKDFEDSIRQVQSVLGEISVKVNKQFSMSGTLNDITSNIPSGIIVDSCSISQEAVKMTCRAPDYGIVEEMEQNFRNNTNYKDVKVTLSQEKESDEVNFNISMGLVE